MTALTALTPLAGTRMGRRLTSPLERGADVHDLLLTGTADPATAQVDTVELAGYLAEHQARFDWAPDPVYVLRTTLDLDRATTVTLTLWTPAGGTQTLPLTLPAGSPAGRSVLVADPDGTPTAVGVVPIQLVADPLPPGIGAAQAWSVTALLGTTAKLLWVVGCERDDLRRHAARSAGQRRLTSAVRAGLDLIGADLGVPRFPPLPYGFDPGTLALYHCDDDPGASVLADVTGAFPARTGHTATLSGGAAAGAAGRFGGGIAFPVAAAVARTATNADFAVPARRDLTVECLVRPSAQAAPGRFLSTRAAAGAAGRWRWATSAGACPGWFGPSSATGR